MLAVLCYRLGYLYFSCCLIIVFVCMHIMELKNV